jgi:hypothetical protein
MPDALDKIRAGAEKAWLKLAANRLGQREYDVQVQDFTPGNRMAGTEGTWTTVFTISPRPRISFRGQFRITEDALMRVADIKLEKVSRSYSEADLRGSGQGELPRRYLINGKPYTFVALESDTVAYTVLLKAQDE